MPLERNARLKFLADMHLVYALNEKVRSEGRWCTFEPKAYHLSMAELYRKMIG